MSEGNKHEGRSKRCEYFSLSRSFFLALRGDIHTHEVKLSMRLFKRTRVRSRLHFHFLLTSPLRSIRGFRGDHVVDFQNHLHHLRR